MTQGELIPRPRRTEPEALVAEALDTHGPVCRRVCLLSGGHDSTVAAHRCRELYDELAHIDTGTALPGVRDFVGEFAEWLGRPLRVVEAGDAYRTLVLGDERWWEFFADSRLPGESLAAFVVRTRPGRRPGDGRGKAPLGFPSPAGGHSLAYRELKERQIEQLVRDLREEFGGTRVALIAGGRKAESRRRMRFMRESGAYHVQKGSRLWVSPLHEWTNDDMRAYRREHDLPESDVSALLHRSGECNCGSYIRPSERRDLRSLYPDWYEAVIAPLEREAERRGVPRHIWGERADTGRFGARGWTEAADDSQTSMDAMLCQDCALQHPVPPLKCSGCGAEHPLDAGERCPGCGGRLVVAEAQTSLA